MSAKNNGIGIGTYSVGDVDIARGYFPAFLVGELDLLHVPDAEGCAAELTPYIGPVIVFGTIAIWVPLYFAYELSLWSR